MERSQHSGSHRARTVHLMIAAACLLFSAAMIAYTGRVLGLDSRATLVTSATFVQHGRWDMNLIASIEWVSPPPGGQGVITPDYDVYNKKAPLLAIALVPFVAMGKLLPLLGVTQAALLAVPLAYAATGALLIAAARRLGASHGLALIGALWWGLGTYTLAGTQVITPELLAGLGTLLAVYTTVGRRSATDALLCGIGLAVAAGSNLALAVFVPVVAVYFFAPLLRQTSPRALVTRLLLWALPLAVTALVVMAFNIMRSGSPFESGYHFASGEGFTTPLWMGAVGLLFSPYRGIIWYAPLTLLSLPGAWLRRRQPITGLMLLLAALNVVLFGTWWSWYGGYGWGPRFLLVTLPLLVLLALPAVQRLWERRGAGRALVIALALASALIQLPGALIHPSYYEAELRDRYRSASWQFVDDMADAAVLNPLTGPLAGTWKYFGRAGTLSPGWALDPARGIPVLVTLLVIAAGQALLLRRVWRGTRPTALWWMALLALFSAGAASLHASAAAAQPEQAALDALLAAHARPGDALLLNELGGSVLLEVDHRPPSYTIPPQAARDERLTQGVLANIRARSQRIWFVTPAVSPNALELSFWERDFVGLYTTAGRYRVVLFDAGVPVIRQPEDVTFGPVTLAALGTAVHPDGHSLYVELVWRGELPADGRLFVHLIDPGGAILVQHDRRPLAGLYPSAGPVLDRHVFPLPPGVDPASLALRIGWVAADGAFIPPAGTPSDRPFLLRPAVRGDRTPGR